MKVPFYCFLPLLLSSCAIAQKDNKLDIQKTKPVWIEIELNTLEDQPFGIPITSEVQSLFFQIADRQEIYEQADKGQFFTFSLSGDTLSMHCSGEPYTGAGKFILLPIPEMKYKVSFDPATYEPSISLFYYYNPVKFGKWVLRSNNSILERKYSFKFNSSTKEINNRK